MTGIPESSASRFPFFFTGCFFESVSSSFLSREASALVYSIVETAKANGLNPFRYLEFLLTEMMEHEEDTDYCFIDDLLPWLDSIPDICKMKNKKEH